MKKILLTFGIVILLSFVISFKINLCNKGKINNVNLENVEALAAAEGEVDLVFCALTQPTLCVIFEDGYFVLGFRQYF